MKKNIDAFSLKWFTILLMSIGSIMGNIAVMQIGSDAAIAPVPEGAWSLYYVGLILYQMSFPLAAFLLVDGAAHTSDKRSFLKRLLLAAVITELPLDLVQKGVGGIKEWGLSQNYFFTLTLGLLVIWMVELLAERFTAGSMKHNLLTLVLYLAAAFLAGILHFEQGGIGVLVIVALYLFRGNHFLSLLAVLALYVLFMGSYGLPGVIPALSILFTWLYNGTEGLHSRKMRLVLYAAYPAICCVYGVIACLIRRISS